MSTLVLRKRNEETQRTDILFVSDQIRQHTLIAGRLVHIESGLRPMQVAVMLLREREEWTLEGRALTSPELKQQWSAYDVSSDSKN